MSVPVHIVSGFLGAGKTSAIRAQLAGRGGEKIAVIVNDFGEAGLDEAILEGDRPFAIRNIPGGCVCCTAPEGFAAALAAVLEQAPDRLLIEPTGLARPQDLVDTIRRCPQRDDLALGPVVVLVDPRRLDARAEDPVARAQIEGADVLVANHTDACDAEQLAAFDALARGLWPAPLAVAHTTHGRLDPQLLEWPAGEGTRLPRAAAGVARGEAEHDHAASSTAAHRVRSWRWSPEVVFDRERLARALLRMAQGLAGAPLARFKGIFRTREGVLLLEVAGGSVSERRSLHRRDSRADAIFAAGGDDPFPRCEAWLAGAVLSDAEREASARQVELVLGDGRVRLLDRDALAALPGGIADVAPLFPKRQGEAARVAALLDSVGVGEAGEAVVCAADGFASEPVPLAALREGVLLHSLAGAALPASQGGPFRLLIPADVPGAPPGCANVKAVTRIVLRGPAAADC